MKGADSFRIGITCYPFLGGSGIVATELGMELAARGHEVHFITSSQPIRLKTFKSNIVFHQVNIDNYPVFQSPPYVLNLAVKMAEVARGRDLDILHVHYAIPHAVSAYLAREIVGAGRIRFITTLHGTDITLVGNRPSFYDITRFTIERSDVVTTVSEFLRRKTLETFDLNREIVVIPNFVDTRRFKPLDVPHRRDIFAATGEKILLHASNFRAVKRAETVVHVFERVARVMPVRLLLMGDGPEISAIDRMVGELGIRDRVVFLGGSESVDEIFPVADLFLLPSRHEGFGLAALEAMSCAVPVIGTSVGGMPEFIRDGINGFLFDPDDIDGMAGKAVELLGDDALRMSIGKNARCTAVQNYSREKIVEKYIEVYRTVL
ncbi:MAG: N-acetyl-alpha-D-glucosaminyl L-malate synthase BshA [bacterium]|nr:MAG: N-acetyl-alpha-D-glucosaminyl L-malate synthase BshA [bacterium]